MIDGLLFGAVDNALLVAGIGLGVEWGELFVPRSYRSRAAGAAVGGFLGNAISDGVAGFAIGPGFALAVFLGCLLPVAALIPVIRRASRVSAE